MKAGAHVARDVLKLYTDCTVIVLDLPAAEKYNFKGLYSTVELASVCGHNELCMSSGSCRKVLAYAQLC